jgi:tetratricopeptide (TPR) repeat protein
MEIHHIVPLSEGGTDDEENGIPLCFNCHAAAHMDGNSPKGRKYTQSELRKHRTEWFRSAKRLNYEDLEKLRWEMMEYIESLHIPDIHNTMIYIAETIETLKKAKKNESLRHNFTSEKGVNLITDPLYYARVGSLELEYKNYEDAISCLSHSIKLDSKQANVYFNLSKAYLYLGRHPEAYNAYSKAVELDPSLGILPEKYHVLDILGRGGIATVYKAKDMITNELVVVKILNGEYVQDFLVASSFEKESHVLSGISNPALLKLHEHGQYKKRLYTVYEYVEATSLEALISSRSLVPAEVLRIAYKIAKAIEIMHMNHIVHRDIKPQNILVLHGGDDIRLIDFSFSEHLSNTEPNSTILAIGTLAYSAPELYNGLTRSIPIGISRVYLSSSIDLYGIDIYAFGATLFHTITGDIPRMEFDIRNLPDGYSKAFWGMILAMLSSDPSKRPVIKEIVGQIKRDVKGLSLIS